MLSRMNRSTDFDYPSSGWEQQSQDEGATFAATEQRIKLTLFTDTHVIRGTVSTRLRRLTDVFVGAEHGFLVVSDATVEEFGSKSQPDRAAIAQVNLSTVLFAATESSVEAQPELRLIKSVEDALI